MKNNNLVKKKNRIIFCFMLLNSNKFVEFLLKKLSIMFNSNVTKKNYKNKFILEVEIEIESFVLLKKFLIFEFKKEESKFKFMYVIINKKKVSVDFFEKNFILIFEKNNLYKILFNFVIKKIFFKNLFLLKFFMFTYFNLIKLLNNIKIKFLNNVYNSSSC